MPGEDLTCRQLRDVLSVVVDMVSIHDVDGVYLYASPASRELLGYEPEDLVGRSAYEFFHPDDLEVIRRSHDSVNGDGGATKVAYRIRRADGSYTWFETTSRVLRSPDDRPERIVTVSRDVSDRVQAERRFELAVEHAPIGMALVGLDGSWLHVNPAVCDLLGYDAPELMALTFQDITHPDDLDADLHLVQECIDGLRDRYDMEKRYIDSGGSELWAHLTVAIVRDAGGEPLHFISQIVDITSRKMTERRLEERALSDPLTGLPNRDAMRRILGDLLRTPEVEATAVLFCDLDGFKDVNDGLGHGVGDEVLAIAASRLSRAIRPSDSVGRIGGDEFLVVCPGVADVDQARGIARRIRLAVGRPMDVSGSVIDVSVSVGVRLAGASEGPEQLTGVVEEADRAMYMAKQNGGVHVSGIDPLPDALSTPA